MSTNFNTIDLEQLSGASGGVVYANENWLEGGSPAIDNWGTTDNGVWVSNETGYTEVSCPAGYDAVLNDGRTDALDVTCSPTPNASDYDGFGPTADNYGAFGESPTDTIEVAPGAPTSVNDAQGAVDTSGVEVSRDSITYYGDNGEATVVPCDSGLETGVNPETGDVGCFYVADNSLTAENMAALEIQPSVDTSSFDTSFDTSFDMPMTDMCFDGGGMMVDFWTNYEC